MNEDFPFMSLVRHEFYLGHYRLFVKFLINLHPQINTGTKLCLAIPAWRYDNSFLRLPILDQLEKIGYNPMSFKNLNPSDLIYFRPNQIVARQMLLLTRK